MPNPFDPASWFMVFVGGLAAAMGNAYSQLLTEIVKILLNNALPSEASLHSPWFLAGIGGTYGLARAVIGLLAVCVALYSVLTPTREHGRKLGQIFTTMIMVAIFAVAFYPVYGVVVSVSKGLTQAMLNLAAGSENATSTSIVHGILGVALPGNVYGKALTAIFASVFGGLALLESFALQIWLLVLLMFYPVVLALRPLNRETNALFNGFNAGIVVVVLSLPAMAFGFLLPVVAKNYLPFGDTGIAAFATTVLGGLIAMIAPPVLLWICYQKSSEIFGRVDAKVGGMIDIGQMPNVTADEMSKSVDEANSSSISAFLSTAAIGAASAELGQSDDLFGDIRKLATEATAAAAAASGNVGVAAVLAATDTTLSKEKRKHESESPKGGV